MATLSIRLLTLCMKMTSVLNYKNPLVYVHLFSSLDKLNFTLLINRQLDCTFTYNALPRLRITTVDGFRKLLFTLISILTT